MLRALQTACSVFIAATLAGVLVFAQNPPSGPPQAPPTFRTGVDLFVLDVSVLDRDRRPVRGLAAGDFTVLEDGIPQAIVTFSAIDVPDAPVAGAGDATPSNWLKTVPSDVVSNRMSPDGRVIVFVLDDVSPMAPGDGARAIALARAAMDRLGPADIAAVVFTSGSVPNQEFTADRGRVRAALDRYVPVMRLDFDTFDESSGNVYLSVAATLRQLVDRLADIGLRRKSVFWVGPGMPISLEAPPGVDFSPGLVGQLRGEWASILERAGRANVNIYGLDPGGNRGEALDLHVGGIFPSSDDAVRGAVEPDSAPLPGASTRPEGRVTQNFLRTVGANTGAFAITGSNDPGPALAQVFLETGSYYLLGYHSSNAASNKARAIQVRVNRPGVLVRSRSRYTPLASGAAANSRSPREKGKSLPPAPPLQALLATALQSLLPTSDVGLRAGAAPFLAGRRPVVAITLGVNQPTPPRQQRVTDDVEVVVSAYDSRGKAAGTVSTHVRVGLEAGSRDVEYEVLTPIDLKPGHYELRAAAASRFLEKAGSVAFSVDVPDFAKARLSLSGIVLSATPGVSSTPHGVFRSFLPVAPTSQRTFWRTTKVTALVRAYEGGGGGITPVGLAVSIANSSGRTVSHADETLSTAKFANDRSAEYRLDLPLDRLEPGPYLLTIVATLGRETVQRSVRFVVD